MLREYVEGVPSGLISCRAGEKDAHILGISPGRVLLRSAEALPPDVPLRFLFYQPEAGGCLTHTLIQYETGEARCENGAVLSWFFFDDPACAAHIRRALNAYARYVELRASEGASAYGHATTGYPIGLDDVFPASPEKARETWFAQLPPLHPGDGCALAAGLNCRELWELYLSTPMDTFWDAYARIRRIPRLILPERKADRLYIGNPFCRLVFPEEQVLEAILAKAQGEGLAVTLVTAEMRAGEEERADRLFALAAKHRLEVEINDWGMLWRAQPFRDEITLLLGTRLNRRRKDPRMQWKAGFKTQAGLLSRNALNDDGYRTFLAELGIRRFEYESCGLATQAPEAACSLHLPFYQTNTSLWCPIHALCTQGDRGAQRPAEHCPRWCESNVLLYPGHLRMLGRWNSLLALDPEPLRTAEAFDRWVLNF